MQRCIRLVYHVKTAYRTDDQRCRKEAYGQSAVSVVSKWKANQKPTDIARVALTLSAMGKDITNVGGVNLAAMLYSSDRLEDGSNELSWTLIALMQPLRKFLQMQMEQRIHDRCTAWIPE